MNWLTWRQFRVPALSVFAGVAVIGVILGITGPDLVGRTDFSDQDGMFAATLIVMYLLPAVIGVFWGVPLITREVESGTHSLVWNQTVTRKRWLATKLGVGVLAAMVAAGLLSLAITWWASPIDALANTATEGGMPPRISPDVFVARGIVPIGYAAFAFVLGVAVGIVLRRTVAAMAVTLVVFAAVLLSMPYLVRPYVLPPLEDKITVTTENLRGVQGNDQGLIESVTVHEPAAAWVLTNETVDPSGAAVSPLPGFVQDCLPVRNASSPPPSFQAIGECMTKLGDRGYQQQVAYQPGYRFWPLQWIELAIFLALSTLLTWFCFRRLRQLS
jgi:hypothetical protein